MEPTHKSSNNDISEIGQDIFRPDGYSFYDELSDTEVIEKEAGKRVYNYQEGDYFNKKQWNYFP